MSSVTRTPECRVKGCPASRDPDWHVPICGHGLEGHHHHVTKRSQGGKDGPQVFICPKCHDNIDNGEWGNSIDKTFEDGKRVTMYRAWDVHNKTVIEQVIGIATKEESDGADRLTSRGDMGEGHHGAKARHGEMEPGVGLLAEPGIGGRDASDVSASPVASTGQPNVLTHEQRVAVAKEIHDTEWNRQWFAGDTGNLWIEQLGESAEQYLSDFGYVHESLANILRVCAAIPPAYRNGNLRFSHHVVVYDENLEDMEMHLAECEEKQWSVAEFRRQRKGTKPRVKRWSRDELVTEVGQFLDGRDAYTEALDAFLDWLEEQANGI